MSIILLAVSTAVLILAALVRAPRTEITTTTEIAASPARVWSWLAQPARYGQWNPFIVALTGELTEGRRLAAVMRPGGARPMRFSPTVQRVRPARELRWHGRLGLPRLFDGEHYFVLEPLADGGTRLVHGEIFQGVLLWFIDVRRFRDDFERLNRALKRRAEAGAPNDDTA
jgi:hypothetical protein